MTEIFPEIFMALVLAGLLPGAYFLGKARGRTHERKFWPGDSKHELEFRSENGGNRGGICDRISPFPPRRPRPAAETAEERRARTIHDNIEAYGTGRAQQEVE